MKITINWEVEDGYVGRSRPQYTEFDSNHHVDDQEWEEMTIEEKQDLICDAVREDFENRISFGIDWGQIEL